MHTHSTVPVPQDLHTPDYRRPLNLGKITTKDLDGLRLLQEQTVDIEAILVRQLEELDLERVPGVEGLCWETTDAAVMLLCVVLDELDGNVLLPLILALVCCVKMSAR